MWDDVSLSLSLCLSLFLLLFRAKSVTKKLILYNFVVPAACDQYERSILQWIGKFFWQIDTVFWQMRCNGIVNHRSLSPLHACWPDRDTVSMMITIYNVDCYGTVLQCIVHSITMTLFFWFKITRYLYLYYLKLSVFSLNFKTYFSLNTSFQIL